MIVNIIIISIKTNELWEINIGLYEGGMKSYCDTEIKFSCF